MKRKEFPENVNKTYCEKCPVKELVAETLEYNEDLKEEVLVQGEQLYNAFHQGLLSPLCTAQGECTLIKMGIDRLIKIIDSADPINKSEALEILYEIRDLCENQKIQLQGVKNRITQSLHNESEKHENKTKEINDRNTRIDFLITKYQKRMKKTTVITSNLRHIKSGDILVEHRPFHPLQLGSYLSLLIRKFDGHDKDQKGVYPIDANHVGIVYEENGQLWVKDAIAKGVVKRKLRDWLDADGFFFTRKYSIVQVFRTKENHKLKLDNLNDNIGKPYGYFTFITYIIKWFFQTMFGITLWTGKKGKASKKVFTCGELVFVSLGWDKKVIYTESEIIHINSYSAVPNDFTWEELVEYKFDIKR